MTPHRRTRTPCPSCHKPKSNSTSGRPCKHCSFQYLPYNYQRPRCRRVSASTSNEADSTLNLTSCQTGEDLDRRRAPQQSMRLPQVDSNTASHSLTGVESESELDDSSTIEVRSVMNTQISHIDPAVDPPLSFSAGNDPALNDACTSGAQPSRSTVLRTDSSVRLTIASTANPDSTKAREALSHNLTNGEAIPESHFLQKLLEPDSCYLLTVLRAGADTGTSAEASGSLSDSSHSGQRIIPEQPIEEQLERARTELHQASLLEQYYRKYKLRLVTNQNQRYGGDDEAIKRDVTENLEASFLLVQERCTKALQNLTVSFGLIHSLGCLLITFLRRYDKRSTWKSKSGTDPLNVSGARSI